MHIAAAMGTRTIGLFGPNTPVRFAPYGPDNQSIYNPLFPHPCINVHKGQIAECDHRHMESISVDEVVHALKKMISKHASQKLN